MTQTVHASNAEGHQVGCPRWGITYAEAGNPFQADASSPFMSQAHQQALRLRPGDQPLPVPNERPDVQSQLIEHIRGRRNLGIQRYGTPLQPFNGRDAGQDLLDELLDGATYAMQLVIERGELEERNRLLQEKIAFLQEENRTLRQDRATLTEELTELQWMREGLEK
jgi:hypothetical protein